MDSNRSTDDLYHLATEYHEEARQESELPRFEIVDHADYPLDSLGPILGAAAKALAEDIQTAPEIAAHSILAVASFAAQDKANVEFDGRLYPLSLFLFTVAESGERKSACDKVASTPILEWQKSVRLEFDDDIKTYLEEYEIYKSEKQSILSRKAISSEEKRELIASLIRPNAPIEPSAVCQEPSLEGLQKSFMHGRPSQALLNDEGGQFFGGHAMNKDNALKTMSGLSKYWDGAPIIRTRATAGESGELFDRRLTVHLQVQPIVARSVLNDPVMIGQGLLARFLIAKADSQAGTRFYKQKNPYLNPAISTFHENVTRLMQHLPETAPGGGLMLPQIHLADEAQSAWIEAYNEVEAALAAGEQLEFIKGIASKAGENAIRIAGVFAVFEDSASIELEHVMRGWKMMFYYLNEALRSSQLKEAGGRDRAAAELREWLKKQPGQQSTTDDIQKKAPRKTGARKSTKHIRLLMQDLVERRWALETEQNRHGRPSAWKYIP